MMLLKGYYKLYNQAKNESLFTQEMQSDRLFYVALTRAKEQLYIIPPTDLENITPKSGYSKILQNIELFKDNENQEYEIFDKYEKKIQKYN
jgi:ATP-dependent exoDNAse (exonuclease V) beta subunit